MTSNAWKIEDVREVVANHMTGAPKSRGNRCKLDPQSANAVATVFDAASDGAKAKMLGLGLDRVAAISWKLVK